MVSQALHLRGGTELDPRHELDREEDDHHSAGDDGLHRLLDLPRGHGDAKRGSTSSDTSATSTPSASSDTAATPALDDARDGSGCAAAADTRPQHRTAVHHGPWLRSGPRSACPYHHHRASPGSAAARHRDDYFKPG